MIIPFIAGYTLAKLFGSQKNQVKQLGYVNIKNKLSKSVIKSMPQEIINYIVKNFDNIYGSPFSSSFYSESGQTWDYTPEGQIRVSDHWNFWSRDYSDPYSETQQHSITNKPVENNTHWTIAKKNKKGIYEVVLSLPKRESLPKNYDNKNDLLASKRPNEVLYMHAMKKAKEIRESNAKERNKKLKTGKLYVMFDRSYTERISARKFNRIEENNVVAILVSETEQFINVRLREGGPVIKYKKSTLSNYKELKRKPKGF